MRPLPLRWLFTTLLVMTAACFAQESPPVAATEHAESYALHEQHPNEGLTIAISPADTEEKAAQFKTPFLRAGLLVVKVIFSNDSATSISLPNLRVELVNPGRFKADPMSTDDIFRRIQRPVSNPGKETPTSRLPIPLPRKQKPRVKSEYEDEVRGMEFLMTVIEPRTTRYGYFVFDISGLSDPLEGAHLYLTGLTNSKGEELFYFEVPLNRPRSR